MPRLLYWTLALLCGLAVAAPAHAADSSDALERLVRRFNRSVEAGDIERAERIAARAARRFPKASAAELMARHLDTIQSDLAAYTDQRDGLSADVQPAALREVWQEVTAAEASDTTEVTEVTEVTDDISTADLLRLIDEGNEAARLLAMRALASKRRDGFHPEAQVEAVREVWEELMRQERFAEASEVVTFGMSTESQVFMHADLIRMYLKAQYKLKFEPSNPSAAAELAEIVAEYNELFQQRRYAEAEMLAKQAKELDPENPATETMLWKTKFARRDARNEEIKLAKEEGFWGALEEVEEAGAFSEPPAKRPKTWEELRRMRPDQDEVSAIVQSATARRIERRLKTTVSLHFEEAPLSKILTHLAAQTGIDIVIDDLALAEEGVTSKMPVTIHVDDVMLKSALNLILYGRHLGYVVEEEVLKITSQRRIDGRLVVRTYPVADLVVPIPDARQFQRDETARCLQFVLAAHAEGVEPADAPRAPVDFDSLIELITTTVEPDSWTENGGEASIRAFETTLSLVVRQTHRRHEEIRDLLEQLRRLQDLQVTMEFRFITVPEDFFERVGVDFDFNVQPAVAESKDGGIFSIQPVEHVELAGGVTTENGRAVLTPEETKRLIECVQQDERSNIMAAPKVTAFNGQRMEVASVTHLNPHTRAVDVALAAQAVISGDRRVISGVIQSEAGAWTGEAKTINFRLPNGHTLLVDCGEIESQSNRNAAGAPILSKVPYVSRLFKNTGVSRPQRRLLMVTPRIIVPEEEEQLIGIPLH